MPAPRSSIGWSNGELVPGGGPGPAGGADPLCVGVLAVRPRAPGGRPRADRHGPGTRPPLPGRRGARAPDGGGAGGAVERRLGRLRAVPGTVAVTGVISDVLLVAGLVIVVCSCAGMA